MHSAVQASNGNQRRDGSASHVGDSHWSLRFPFFIGVNGDRLIQSGNSIGVDAFGDLTNPFEVSIIMDLRCVRHRTLSSFKDIPVRESAG